MRRTVRTAAPPLPPRPLRACFESLEARTLLAAQPGQESPDWETGAQPSGETASFAEEAPSQPAELTFRAAADTYVRNGSYSATNFGSASSMQVSPTLADGSHREAYLRFDVPEVAQVGSAVLRVFGRFDTTRTASADFHVLTSSDVGWDEGGITWNTALTYDGGGSTTWTAGGTTGRWYEVDVSGIVQQRVDGGADAVTFIIRGASPSASTLVLDSDEGANAPQLTVRRDPPAVPPELVVVTAYRAAHEGQLTNFDVRLATRPASDVTVTLTKQAGDDDLTVATGTVTLTPDDWYRAKAVRVAAGEDADSSNGWATFLVSAEGAATRTVTAAEIDTDAPTLPEGSLGAGADAHVRAGSYANTNYGGAATLEVRASGTTSSNRETYVEFDLAGMKTFQRASLRLYGALADTSHPYVEVSVGTATGPWSESGITWNNRPARGRSVIGKMQFQYGTTPRWFDVDVTHWVLQQKAAGAASVTFVLFAAPTTSLVRLNSDEASANRPELRLTNFEPSEPTEPPPPPPPPPTGTTTAVRAGADAYVRDGSYASTNYGGAAQLQVKRGSAGYNRDAYLRFDVSGVTADSSAKLRLFGRLDNTQAASAGFTVYASPDTTWGESALTWSARPAAGTTVVADGTVTGTSGAWYELDVTDFVRQQKAAGAGAVTLVLKASAASASTILFESDEAAANRPELLVTQAAPVETPQALVVSTSDLSVPENGSATFTVRLAARPAADVAVTVTRAPAGTGDGDLAPNDVTLAFTPDNWDVPQAVSISAAPDADSSAGSNVYTVSAAGLESKTVTVTEVDDDAATGPTALRAVADAYVRDGTHAGANFGTASQLQVKRGAAGYTRDSYLRFDLSGLTTVSSARLRLWGMLDNTQAASAGFTVYTAADTAWGETAVNWNSRPPSDAVARAAGTVSGTTGKWYEVDLTSLFQELAAAGATAVTLVLKASAASGSTVLFNSDEAATNRPELVLAS